MDGALRIDTGRQRRWIVMAGMHRHRPAQSSEPANRQQQRAVPLRQVMQRLVQDSVLLPSVFDGVGAMASTAGTNLWETGGSYVIQAAMPGMQPESIQVTVEQEMLTVRGAAALPAPEQATALWQSFGGQAEASYEQGILTVRLPKAAHAQAHTIRVRAT
jgi:HSP20 family protein